MGTARYQGDEGADLARFHAGDRVETADDPRFAKLARRGRHSLSLLVLPLRRHLRPQYRRAGALRLAAGAEGDARRPGLVGTLLGHGPLAQGQGPPQLETGAAR